MKEKIKLLFVCILNLQRSPTAESLFDNNEKYEAESCGIDIFAKKQINEKVIKWADIIFCMENIHKKFILERFPKESKGKKIIVLDIPDVYFRDDPELREILAEKLDNWL